MRQLVVAFRVVAALVLASAPLAASAAGDDFRGMAWGSSIDQVKAAEKAKFFGQSADSLVYKDTVAGIHMAVMYKFAGGALVEGSYLSEEQHTNKNDYISDYEKIKGLLTKKYGAPKRDDHAWRDDLYKDKPSDWGLAVSIGHLVYRAEWRREHTTILTALRGDNFEITHGLIYQDSSSQPKLKQEEDKRALDNL